MENIVEEFTFKSTSRVYTAHYPYAKKDKHKIITDVNNSITASAPNNQNYRTSWLWGLSSASANNLILWIDSTFKKIFAQDESDTAYNINSFYIAECWANTYTTDGYAMMHNHFPYTYSFLYYLNAPKNSSPTFFDGLGEILPEEGKCIFFPSSMAHAVPTCNIDNRMTIAGNILYSGPINHNIGGGDHEKWNLINE